MYVLPVMADSNFPSNNRYASGKFDIKKSKLIKVSLGYVPARLSAEYNGKSLIVSALSDKGRVSEVIVKNGRSEVRATEILRNPHSELYTGRVRSDASPMSSPKDTKYGQIYIDKRGSLHIGGRTLMLNATYDNEVAVSGNYAVVLIKPTKEYSHDVLGDSTESKGFAVVDLNEKEVIAIKDVSYMGVIEQKGVLLADIDDDGVIEITATISNSSVGASVVSFGLDGRVKYVSGSIGRGFRWRHVFGAADFGDFIGIVNVVTPHIGGTLELLTPENNNLVRKTYKRSYSSHSIGSANLGMGLIADTDGDGKPEILVPDTSKRNIQVVAINDGKAEKSGEINFSGKLSTEITAVRKGDNLSAVIFGTDAGELNIYLK